MIGSPRCRLHAGTRLSPGRGDALAPIRQLHGTIGASAPQIATCAAKVADTSTGWAPVEGSTGRAPEHGPAPGQGQAPPPANEPPGCGTATATDKTQPDHTNDASTQAVDPQPTRHPQQTVGQPSRGRCLPPHTQWFRASPHFCPPGVLNDYHTKTPTHVDDGTCAKPKNKRINGIS